MIVIKVLVCSFFSLFFTNGFCMNLPLEERTAVVRVPVIQQLSSTIGVISTLSMQVKKSIQEGSSIPQLLQGQYVVSTMLEELHDLNNYCTSIFSTFEITESCIFTVNALAQKALEIKPLLEEWLKPTCSTEDTRKLRFALEEWRVIFFGKYGDEENKLMESPIFENMGDRLIAERETREIARLERMKKAQSLSGEIAIANFRIDSDIKEIKRTGKVKDAEAASAIAKANLDTDIVAATRSLTVQDAVTKIASNITQTMRDMKKAEMEIDMLPFKREVEEANMAMDLAEKRMKVLESKAKVEEAEAKAREAEAKAFEAKEKALAEVERERIETDKVRALANVEVCKKELETAKIAAETSFAIIKGGIETFRGQK